MNFVFVAVLLSLVAMTFAQLNTTSNCGGNCPGGCDSCPCGTSTNYVSVSDWCAQHSWNQVRK